MQEATTGVGKTALVARTDFAYVRSMKPRYLRAVTAPVDEIVADQDPVHLRVVGYVLGILSSVGTTVV